MLHAEPRLVGTETLSLQDVLRFRASSGYADPHVRELPFQRQRPQATQQRRRAASAAGATDGRHRYRQTVGAQERRPVRDGETDDAATLEDQQRVADLR